MTSQNPKGQSLNAVTVMLVLADQSSLDYLQNILRFIDCDVHIPASPQDLQRLVGRYDDRAVAVLLSGQLPDQDRSSYLRAISECEQRPALIQVQEHNGDDMLVSGDVLGRATSARGGASKNMESLLSNP